MASGPIVVRRALGSARDARLVAEALRAAGVTAGPELAAALATDAWGLVLVAERAAAPCGVAVLRLHRAPGAPSHEAVSLALVDVLHGEDETREALLAAARAEADAREAARFVVLTSDVPAPKPVASATVDARSFTLAQGVTATLDPTAVAMETSTLWSGAVAFRARWRSDRYAQAWTVDGCVGCLDDDGDALRFDAETRALREVYLTRPARHRLDDALLALAASAPVASGVLRVDSAAPFTLGPMDVALFDVSLGVFAAVRAEVSADVGPLTAVAASPHLALLFAEGVYVGWRVLDPAAHARPMGWPEAREADGVDDARAASLRALLYDWMVIDASPRVHPVDAASPDEVEHMTALRDRARALAEGGDDVVSGVARDVAAHAHWSWGFYRLGP
jgi:hypothetical protein